METYRIIEVFSDQDVTFLGHRMPSTYVAEDEEGVRVLFSDTATISGHTWANSHALGVALLVVLDLLADLPTSGWITTEDFMANREEHALDGVYTLDRSFLRDVLVVDGGMPGYRYMVSSTNVSPVALGLVHLHLHSEFSPLDGLSTISEIVEAASNDDQEAVALTDHGYCSGHPALQEEASKRGIKPIFGMEAYLVGDRHARGAGPLLLPDPPEIIIPEGTSRLASREIRESTRNSHEALVLLKKDEHRVKVSAAKDYNHLILWAMNRQGLSNLWALSTLGFREGFYNHPRIDWDALARYQEGVMCSTACLRGPLAREILRDDEDAARVVLGRLLQIFGDRLYAEIHTNQLPDQIKVNEVTLALASEFGVPPVAVVDSHYCGADDAHVHKVWLASQTNGDLGEGSLFQGHEDYHIQTAVEVRENLAVHIPDGVVSEAMSNTIEVARRCDAQLQQRFVVPLYSNGGTEAERRQRDRERAVDMCITNWAKTEGKSFEQDAYIARFERESDLLTTKGFWGYYLQVADQVGYAKSNGKLVGPGRGSGAGSLIAYLMGITGVDPVEHGLLFERFLTEGREEPPDFDVDYPSTARDLMQDYCTQRWGDEYTMRVGTHTRLKNKGVFSKLQRIYKEETDYVDFRAIAKIIDDAESGEAGAGLKWDDLWSQHGDALEPYRDKYPKIFELAAKMVGRLNTYGKHAAGMVISSDEKLVDNLPMRMSDNSNQPISQFDMDALTFLGYIKFDILTLRTLDTLQMCIDLIEKRTSERVDPYEWIKEYDDPWVWDEISQGHTKGVFQIETPDGTKMTRQFKPRSVADLADVITLVRPGPRRSGLTQSYLNRKEGLEEVDLPDPRLAEVLEPTFGCIIYQEQVMKTCQLLGDYTLAEADGVRKILGKKKVDKVKSAGEEFIARCIVRGMDQKAADHLWEQLGEFAKYSFNKSHAFAYAMIGHWCVAGPTRLYDWDNQRYVTIAKAYREGIKRIACYDEATGQTIPGDVAKVVKTGRKMGYVLRTKSNKRLECSEMHLILTDTGWRRVKDILPGDLVASERRVSVMSAERRAAIADGMKTYWSQLPSSEVEQRILALNDGQDFLFRSDRAKARWEVMDQVERQERIAVLIDSASGGRWDSRRQGISPECGHKYASRNEREVCRWMHRNEIEHESQVFVNGRPADFRCQGVFIEFDGIGRDDSYFEEKFGDEPYVVIRDRKELDRDLGFLLEEGLLLAGGVVTFEPVISITPTKEVVMYDVMMVSDPHNFLADGVVVHNTAWFKFHHPIEFLTAALSTVDSGRIPEFIAEGRRMGYSVLPPDINESGPSFTAGEMGCRYGFEAVDKIGDKAAAAIMEGQPYSSFEDFMERKGAKANMGHVKILARVGAFDSIHPNRRALVERLEYQEAAESTRCTFKDETVDNHGLPCHYRWDEEPVEIGKSGRPKKGKPPPKNCTRACRNYTPPETPSFIDLDPYTDADIRDLESEFLGVWLSSTPFDRIPKDLLHDLKSGSELESIQPADYNVAVIINKVRSTKDRFGNPMGFIDCMTTDINVNVTCFKDNWPRYKPILHPGDLYLATVRKNERGYSLLALVTTPRGD